MPSEVLESSGGIGNTIAWKLIYGIHQSRHHFSCPPDSASIGSSQTQELQKALCKLDAKIRTTFTTPKLEPLLLLESELPNDAPEASFDSKSDDESSSDSIDPDREDASSQSNVGSSRMAEDKERFEIPSHLDPPLDKKALLLLRGLCSFLEARVNPLLIPVQPGDTDRASGYPRLARLLGYVQSLPVPPQERLDSIPIPGSGSAPFLFDITEDGSTAAAFVALRDPKRPPPPEETRWRMLSEVESMTAHFLDLISFVNSLKISVGRLDDRAPPSRSGDSTTGSFDSFTLLQSFQRQTAAALRAVFSHLRLCDHRKSMKHKIRPRLPAWEVVSGCHATDAPRNLPVQLFFTSCPDEDWQPATMYFLQSEHIDAYTRQKLCGALRSAYASDRDLEFYVSEHSESTDRPEIPIHIPINPKTASRIHGDSFPTESLWTLIKHDHFAKTKTFKFLKKAGGDAGIMNIDQRKSLALKLVLGLMLSIGSEYIIGTWDPNHIHFLKPADTEYTPFVSIYENGDSSSYQGCSSLAKLDISKGCKDGEEELRPLLPFTLLAKELLHIACGEPLEEFKIAPSGRAFQDGWKALRRALEVYTKEATDGNEADLETLPFLVAAQNCLDFHTRFQARLMSAQSNNPKDIAWKVMFEDIIAQIDNSLTLEKLTPPRTDAITKEEAIPVTGQAVAGKFPVPAIHSLTETSAVTTVVTQTLEEKYPLQTIGDITAQPAIVLFDVEDSMKGSVAAQRATSFFEALDGFHESYTRFVTPRLKNDSVEESPRRIRIAVLDTGIDFGHPGIMSAKEEGRVKREWCHSWVGAAADIHDEDDRLHGTNCVYLLHKAAPEADIYVEKVFRSNNFRICEAQNISNAIEHAVKAWDVDIISMSFGLRRPIPRTDGGHTEERLALQEYRTLVDDIETTIRDASAKSPRIFFAAASNNGKNEGRAFPARYGPWVICVHASDGKGGDGGINPPTECGANFMTLGMGLELMEREGPCVRPGMRTQRQPYKTVYRSGTSFGTPIAAGIAATVLDLAVRVSAINDRTRKKLRRCEEMVKMLSLMSIPKHDISNKYCFLAPWNHWKNSWQADETKSRLVWDLINDHFDA